MGPARMRESLTTTPGIREQPRPGTEVGSTVCRAATKPLPVRWFHPYDASSRAEGKVMKRRSRIGGKSEKPERHKATPKRPRSAKAVPNRSTATRQETEIARLARERDEASEQQRAMTQVLRVISSSPGELEPVFYSMLGNATRLCGAEFGVLWLAEGNGFRAVALHNVPVAFKDYVRRAPIIPTPGTTFADVIKTRRSLQVSDIREREAYKNGNPFVVAAVDLGEIRTLVNVPMIKDNSFVGVVAIFRKEVDPFTEKQIALVENFAAQAVIAIENARLLNELRKRTADLTEALEQQTATAEVLRVISSSPDDLEPVFQAMLENATRICDAKFGMLLR